MSEATISYNGQPAPAATGGYALQPGPAPVTTQPVTTQSVQGAVENGGPIDGGERIPFGPPITIDEVGGQAVDPGFGWDWFEGQPRRTFRIADSIGLMPLLRFAHASKTGMDTEDMEGMAALYTMIRDTVDPGEWDAFQDYATDCKADENDLMEFVSAAIEVISARPRRRRGSSSATSPTTSEKSKASSSPPVSATPPGDRRPAELDGLLPVSELVK